MERREPVCRESGLVEAPRLQDQWHSSVERTHGLQLNELPIGEPCDAHIELPTLVPKPW